MLAGELTAATLIVDEARSLAEATGNPPLAAAPIVLAAWRGDESQAADADGSQLRGGGDAAMDVPQLREICPLQRPRPT